jgi:hypothetical protein
MCTRRLNAPFLDGLDADAVDPGGSFVGGHVDPALHITSLRASLS